MWDMRDRRRQQTFTEAVDRFYRDVLERQVPHDGHRELRQHIANARRRTNQWGYSIGKEHRESARKVDLAVCAIGARML
ncbi:terminase, partial [Streptomyces sp. A73]|nr:terminase [Streptomyces sp. A73]